MRHEGNIAIVSTLGPTVFVPHLDSGVLPRLWHLLRRPHKNDDAVEIAKDLSSLCGQSKPEELSVQPIQPHVLPLVIALSASSVSPRIGGSPRNIIFGNYFDALDDS